MKKRALILNRKLTATLLSAMMLLSFCLVGCNTSSKPPDIPPSGNGSGSNEEYLTPRTEVYSWANDTSFRSLSREEKLDLISYDLFIEDDYYSQIDAVVVSQDGSVYVIGCIFDGDTIFDSVLIRYDAELNQVAVVGKPSYSIWGHAIDSKGNVYTTGFFSNYTYSEEYGWHFESGQPEIIKYNSNLEELAVNPHQGYLRKIVIAPDGSVYTVRTMRPLDGKASLPAEVSIYTVAE
ncbi:MAG: hypothetical protein FWD45_05905 [Coriobacteriia bacterium]|nr:hypothetical protein [Coriobacteriia bacterium]